MARSESKTFLPVRFRKRSEMGAGLRAAPAFVLDEGLRPAQPNQSVIDAMRVLQVLVFTESPVSASDLSRELGFDLTRAHRLLRTLSLIGMAHQLADKRFTPGPAMHVLSAQSLFNSDLAAAARGPLDLLHQQTGLEVALGILWQDYVSYLYHAAPDMPLEAAIGNVSIFPASRSSLGHVLMGDLPDAQIRLIYRDRPVMGYEDSGVEQLLVDVREARTQGFARVERKGVATGRVSVAVRVTARPFAAVGVGGDIPAKKTAELIARLRTAVEQIGENLARGSDAI